MEIEQGDVVLCTVDRIIGTTVFVKINSLKDEPEGTIVTSEIAPGRIRNLRDYVVPKKKIVCKVLRISGNQINLSLRRVTQKEKREVIERTKQEKSYEKIIESTSGKDSKSIIEKIKEKENLYDFLEEAKENSGELEKISGKENAKKILDILKEQKDKKIDLKKEIKLTSIEPNGLDLIKEILDKKEIEIRYISAGKYSLKKESTDLKKANSELKEYIAEFEKKAKEKGMEISVIEK